MKMLNLLIITVFCLASISAQTSPTDPKNSQTTSEADKISIEVVKLFQQKKYEEALPLAQKTVELREREVGKNNILLAQALRNLAYIYLRLNKSKDSENTFEKAFEIYDKNQPLAIEDEKVYVGLLETVAIYQALGGGLEKAEKKLWRALEFREKINGKDSIETADVLLKISEIYQVLGNYEKASPLLKRAFEIKNTKLGLNDDTKGVYLNLTCTLTKLGKTEELAELKDRVYPKPKDEITGFSSTSNDDKDSKTVSGGVVNGKAINLVRPEYPAEARAKRASGTVVVAVTIDETGNIIHACAQSGMKELQRSSELAAYNSKFSPTLVEGKPVKVTGVIVYNYTAR